MDIEFKAVYDDSEIRRVGLEMLCFEASVGASVLAEFEERCAGGNWTYLSASDMIGSLCEAISVVLNWTIRVSGKEGGRRDG